MTVLVTGGAGYIGSHVALALIEAGRRVVVLDDLRTGFRELVPPQAVFVEGNVGDRALLDQVFSRRIHAVMHFAAATVVSDSIAHPLSYYDNNTVSALTLLQAAINHRVEKFIFSSTAAVYGATPSNLIHEDSPLLPASPYGSSKLMVERMLRDATAAHGIPTIALRYFNVAGADLAGRSGQKTRGATHLIKAACEVAVGHRKRLLIFGEDYPTPDGTCIRDFIHVSDLANAHILALHLPMAQGDSAVFNVGYGRGHSVREVVTAVEVECGHPLPVEFAPRRVGDVPFSVADPQRLKSTLGWHPEFQDLQLIVRSALAYERGLALA